jgi:transposase-like protein
VSWCFHARKPGSVRVREGVRLLSQALLEMEVEEHVGAARHERSPERTGQRNGYTATEVGTRGLEPWS